MLANGGLSAVDRSSSESSESLGRPEALTEAYASLIAQELSRDLAERVIAVLQDELDPKSLADPKRVREALLAQVSALVPTAEDLEFVKPRDGRPRTIAFVGPTGVGKTTTLAKIAATMTLREGIRVGLVTADTYRIAAVDQLRTYADILGLRLEVASDPSEMRAALDRCSDLDAVLIDTPGRSQNDADRIADLRALIDAARPHETHLVLSGTAAERVLLREAEAFSTLGPDRVVLTKLDEAVTFGMLVSVVRRIGRRISWVTTGQEVPNDVERATSERLANLMLGEPVKS
jgi:flagellar biosynthesis protein FlhF